MDDFAGSNQVAGPRFSAIHQHGAFANRLLDFVACRVFDMVCKEDVESLSFFSRRNDDVVLVWHPGMERVRA